MQKSIKDQRGNSVSASYEGLQVWISKWKFMQSEDLRVLWRLTNRSSVDSGGA